MIDYSLLPEHMQDGARLYIEKGISPGGFMLAVLSNDLKAAVGRADSINLACIKDWALWLVSECPMAAQGSPEKVDKWIASGGIAK